MITGQLKRVIELQSLPDNSAIGRNRICAIVSGKGGTGKTVFSLILTNLSARKGKKVLLIDLDINLANIHFLLNEVPQKTLNNYFLHNDELKDIISEYSDNFHIIFGHNAYSIKELPFISTMNKLLQDIRLISENYDLVILDLGAGLNEFVLNVLKNSGIKIIVSLPEPTSVMDAYAVIKMYESYYGPSDFDLVFNRCQDSNEGVDSFIKLSKAVQSFLKSSVRILTYISESRELRYLASQQSLSGDIISEESFITAFQTAADKIDKYIHLTNINQTLDKDDFSSAKNNSKSSINL